MSTPINLLETLDAMKEVLRISDRKHDAWDKARAGIAYLESLAGSPADNQPVPFGYFHELLDHTGKGNGVWLGCKNKSVVEQSYIEGEVSKDIITLYAAPQAVQPSGDARLNWLIDWYLRGGLRSEIHEHGHMVQTTKEIILTHIDKALSQPAQPSVQAVQLEHELTIAQQWAVVASNQGLES